MREYVVFDLEANADRSDPPAHEIIEIGAVLVVDGTESSSFSTLVRPTRPLRSQTRELTGLTDEELARAPVLGDALRQFTALVGDRPLIAHNGFGYDFPLLDAAAEHAGMPPIGRQRLDTLELAHVAIPRSGRAFVRNVDGTSPPPGRSLDDLGEYLVGQPRRTSHRALDDAQRLAAVLPRLLELLDEDAPAQRLQRWVLTTAGHPWSAFLTQVGCMEDLADVVPAAEQSQLRPPQRSFSPPVAAALLDTGGALMTDGRQPRPQQVEMARIVGEAMATGSRHLIEAPTGTGKTLAYLVPAIEYARATGGTVAVAPHTRVLQDQIMTTLESLREEIQPFSSVQVKGRTNYLSLEALAGELDALAELEAPHGSQQDVATYDIGRALALAIVCGWVAKTPTGDWDDLRTWTLTLPHRAMTSLRLLLSSEAESGPARTSLDDLDFHRRARNGLRTAHVAVLNHALVVVDEDWLDHAKVLVLDEAHNLEDAATDALSAQVDESDIQRLCDSLDDPVRRSGTVYRVARAAGWSLAADSLGALRDSVVVLRRRNERFCEQVVNYVRMRTGASADDTYPSTYRLRAGIDTEHLDYSPVLYESRELARALLSVAEALNDINLPAELHARYRRDRLEGEIRRLGRSARSHARIVRMVSRAHESENTSSETADFDTLEPRGVGGPTQRPGIGDLDSEQWVAIASIEYVEHRWTWSLRSSPVSVAGALSARWKSLRSAVFTSATLSTNGRFEYILGSLGLGAARTHQLESPFEQLEQNHLFVLADYLPAPRARMIDEFTHAAMQEIGRLLLLTDGRGLVLATARRRMEATRDHIRPHLEARGIPLLAQGEAPAVALAERMRNELATSLLALRSFWEGVDVPGEALSLLLIEKIPFDSPADPVVGARMEALQHRGKDPFADYAVPRAALRLAQGAGRLIRTATDRGVTVMLDNRLCRATPYRDVLRQTLPGPPTYRQARTPTEAYEWIADHLGDVTLDDAKRVELEAVPSPEPWQQLRDLRLEANQVHGRQALIARLEEVRAAFGFESWRPGQLQTMTRFLEGRDVLALLPTGSGKSLTFQIPALLSDGITLVISPLIALMNDQVSSLRDRDIEGVAAIHSGVSQSEWRDLLRAAQQGHYRLLYVSPERLWLQEFVETLASIGVARIAIDEAHCISQWGHSFRPEYARIPEAVQRIAERSQHGAGEQRPPILAVTATANRRVRDDIVQLLDLRGAVPIVRSPDRPEIRYLTEYCPDMKSRDERVAQIVDAYRGQAAIVYVPRRRDTERIAGLLRAAGHPSRAYHGGMEATAREHVEDTFRHGEINVVVATKAFGLGIDKPDIALVVHLEMPATIEEYVQETGRAARGSGQPGMPEVGTAVLLVTPRDCGIHRQFVRGAAPSLAQVRRLWWNLRPGYATYDPSELTAGDDTHSGADGDDVESALALHYLIEAGAVRRHPDTAWRGRVTTLGDTAEKLAELGERAAQTTDREAMDLVTRAERLLEFAEDRDGRYEAEVWQQALDRPAAEIASDLLELNRRDVIGFSVWRYAWVLDRGRDQPSEGTIERVAEDRRKEVERKSEQAREFARNRRDCRVVAILNYLDAQDAAGGALEAHRKPRPSTAQADGCGVATAAPTCHGHGWAAPSPWRDCIERYRSAGLCSGCWTKWATSTTRAATLSGCSLAIWLAPA